MVDVVVVVLALSIARAHGPAAGTMAAGRLRERPCLVSRRGWVGGRGRSKSWGRKMGLTRSELGAVEGSWQNDG